MYHLTTTVLNYKNTFTDNTLSSVSKTFYLSPKIIWSSQDLLGSIFILETVLNKCY